MTYILIHTYIHTYYFHQYSCFNCLVNLSHQIHRIRCCLSCCLSCYPCQNSLLLLLSTVVVPLLPSLYFSYFHLSFPPSLPKLHRFSDLARILDTRIYCLPDIQDIQYVDTIVLRHGEIMQHAGLPDLGTSNLFYFLLFIFLIQLRLN